ncbi:MAG: hypothetical protein KAU90_11270, partial [Sulfurovaceae bacterium]|nr:hypothetical protein [Sulfurovaceae bacterium]
LMVSLKKGNYLLDVYDASFNNSCSNISLNKISNNYSKSLEKGAKNMSKIKRLRNLPKRQYY